MLTVANYQHYTTLFKVEPDLIRRSIARCEPLLIDALSIHAQPHLWRGELPVYSILTTPQDNGGWGHLMPFWFKPQDRPVPFYALENWALFALVYAGSFGPSDEAKRLVKRVFTVENVVRTVVGTNLQLPFLPSTQGRGRFFRHGMLPFLLSMLWLDEDTSQAWFRLHELSAQRLIAAHGLATAEDPITMLTEMEYAIFGRLERNTITNDEAVAAFLSQTDDPDELARSPSLLSLYQDMFGAIGLGVTALANYYQDNPLGAWREWVGRELAMPYRMHDYGIKAIKTLLDQSAVGSPLSAPAG
jgi:hypothetical protein